MVTSSPHDFILKRYSLVHHTVKVEARETKPPNHVTMANVNVTLLDENDNSPKFTSSKYESKVFTNQTEGMLLVKVTKLYNTVYCPTNITVIQLINGSKTFTA